MIQMVHLENLALGWENLDTDSCWSLKKKQVSSPLTVELDILKCVRMKCMLLVLFFFFCTLIYLCLPCKYFIGFLLQASTMKTELCSFFLTKNKVYSKGVGGIIWKSIHELNHPIQYRNISLHISIYPISLPYLQQHKYCYLAICRSYFEQLQL